MAEAKQMLAFRIDPQQARLLDGLALMCGSNRSDVLRRLIDKAGRDILAVEKESAVPASQAGRGASF